MTDEEISNRIRDKCLEIGNLLEGIPLDEVMWILSNCTYGMMHQYHYAKKDNKKS